MTYSDPITCNEWGLVNSVVQKSIYSSELLEDELLVDYCVLLFELLLGVFIITESAFYPGFVFCFGASSTFVILKLVFE